jgi:hypothetical protein
MIGCQPSGWGFDTVYLIDDHRQIVDIRIVAPRREGYGVFNGTEQGKEILRNENQ